MAIVLKQNDTAAELVFGPAVDVTDGFTPETGLLASTVDALGLYKPGATVITTIATTEVFESVANGYYRVTLASTAVDTVGNVRVVCRDDSIALPFWIDAVVMDPDAFDALFATATTTGNLSFLDIAVSSRATSNASDIWDLATRTLTAATVVWAELTSISTATTTFGGILDAPISSRSTLATTDLILASAIWAEPLSANATATTLYGGLIQKQLDAAVSSRSTLATTDLILASAIWAEPLAANATATTLYGGLIQAHLDIEVSSRATSNAADTWAATGDTATGAPPLDPTRAQQMDWSYTLGRNEINQTSTFKSVLGSATTITLATAAVSDDGTTYTRGVWG